MDSDSTHSIVVAVEAPGWRSVVTGPETFSRSVAETVLDIMLEDASRHAELSLVLTDDCAVRELNRIWRDQDQPTNVLSFPSGEIAHDLPAGAPWLLGDVVVALETVCREAEAARKPVGDHLTHLLVHGILHLLGHDHEEDAEAERMERLERDMLQRLGVPDPYATAAS